MREAAFPNFKKLYGVLNRVDRTVFSKGLPAGNYSLEITYSILSLLFQLLLLNHACGPRLSFSRCFPLSSPLWSSFDLDLCLSRLPCAVLPRQKGSGPDHADLVWRSEPFPAHCLPRNQQLDLPDGHHSHRVLVEVWEGWEEHGGMKGKTCGGMVEKQHLESDNQSELRGALIPANVSYKKIWCKTNDFRWLGQL